MQVQYVNNRWVLSGRAKFAQGFGFSWDGAIKRFVTSNPKNVKALLKQRRDVKISKTAKDNLVKPAFMKGNVKVVSRSKLSIDYSDGRWIARCSYEDRHIPKSYRFQWDADAKVWYTTIAGLAKAMSEDGKVPMTIAAKEALNPVQPTYDIKFPAQVTPFPYQVEGIEFALARKNTLLADDMGLGKSLQAIGVMNTLGLKNVLIVCPKTLMLNWRNEIKKFGLPSLPTVALLNTASEEVQGDTISIINYNILNKQPWIFNRSWDLLILDEAHYIKNPKTIRAKAIKKILSKTDKRLFLTGTPIMNRPAELYPILKFLELNVGWVDYVQRYCAATRTKWGWDTKGASNLPELQALLRSTVMIRRLKKDVLKDLPDKTYQFIPLSPDDFEDILRKEANYRADYEHPIQHLRERMRDAHRRGVKVDDFAKQLRTVQGEARASLFRLMHETAVAKIPYAIEHIKELLEEGPLVVFAHHKNVIDAIYEAFPGAVKVTGEDSTESRQNAVESFQEGKSDLFIGSIKACSTGITLTRASTVLFVEQTLVPADLDQAADRCHRIGQKNNVLVQFLVIDKSLDQELTEMIATKKDIINAALNAD